MTGLLIRKVLKVDKRQNILHWEVYLSIIQLYLNSRFYFRINLRSFLSSDYIFPEKGKVNVKGLERESILIEKADELIVNSFLHGFGD